MPRYVIGCLRFTTSTSPIKRIKTIENIISHVHRFMSSANLQQCKQITKQIRKKQNETQKPIYRERFTT